MLQRVIYWGHREPVEFRDAANWLEAHCDCRFVQPGKEPDVGDWVPDWIILAQQRPREFRPADAERLMVRFPLAAQIGLLGSWCEGESRTGKPLPGIYRVFWHQWQPRFERFLLGQSPDSPQRLPRTASDVEIMMADQVVPRPSQRTSEADRAWISLRTRPTALIRCSNARWPIFRELLAEWGLQVQRVVTADFAARPDRSEAADWNSAQASSALFYLFDTGPGTDSDRSTFALDVHRFRPRGTIVIVDFPRWQERLEWSRAGANQLLARPWLLADLAWCLRLLGSGLVEAVPERPESPAGNPPHEPTIREFRHPPAILPRKPRMTSPLRREQNHKAE